MTDPHEIAKRAKNLPDTSDHAVLARAFLAQQQELETERRERREAVMALAQERDTAVREIQTRLAAQQPVIDAARWWSIARSDDDWTLGDEATNALLAALAAAPPEAKETT